MNTCKKLLAALLIVALALFLVACGGDPKEQASASSVPGNSQKPASASNANDSAPPPAPSGAKHDSQQLQSTLVEAYMGLTEGGETIYYAGNDDGSIALLMFYDPHGNQHYVFAGPIVDNGNGTATITDEADGLTFTFGIEGVDGGLVIDMGDNGYAVMGESTVNEVIDVMLQIESGSDAVGGDSSGAQDGGEEEYFSQDLTITNNTGVTIMELYISPTQADQWSNDLMGSEVFSNGVTLKFSTDLVGMADATWDILIVDEDGDQVVFTGVNFSAATAISLSWGSDGQTPTVTAS